jgi:hypothetical protein
MNESPREVIRKLTEAKPDDAKVWAKLIADGMGGKVHGSKAGWGTDVSGIAKSKAGVLAAWLKSRGFKDVSKQKTYRQLIAHLGDKAWVYTKNNVTVRFANVDEILIGTKPTKQKNLVVNVLYA